ncbi:MAG: PD-(D/E)XK nuclease family protein [Oscillatoriales cyanobacterium SM2_1_8]|nr:PD-(D/E)XK nuclease family protein [Oscillatoriales cyanobacterium SM2_1_8]
MTLWLLSQSHFGVWDACPRQYAYRYEEGLAAAFLAEDDRLALGSQFHQLRQQAELGLPIAAEDPLHTWLQRFEVSLVLPPGERLTECRRTCLFPDASPEAAVLTAIYDLLIVGDRTAHIYDWKTHREPPPPRSPGPVLANPFVPVCVGGNLCFAPRRPRFHLLVYRHR